MYSVAQAAEILTLHPKTVRRFIRDGRIRANKVGREWRIRREDLREFAHGELAGGTDEKQSSRGISDRIRVSAVIELDEGNSTEVSRISNSLIAVLNSDADPGAPARYDLIFHPETRKARFVLYGSPRFIATLLELVETLTQRADELI